MDTERATEWLRSWATELEADAKRVGFELEMGDRGKLLLRVTLLSETHAVDICAWDNASCLDIQVLDLKSEESTFPTVGPCHDQREFCEHLKSLRHWIMSAEGR